MKLGMVVLFPGAITIVLQSFFTGTKGAANCSNLTLESGEVLEINTTTPSIIKNNCCSCHFAASHENRNSSSLNGEHRAAVIKISGDIVLRSGSTIKVFGKYGLSLTSETGSILIQSDINMTCEEKVLNETCLGGFTLSSEGVGDDKGKYLFKGLGPGSPQYNSPLFNLKAECIPGSSHGGNVASGDGQLTPGPAYDKNDTSSLLGGSGGSCVDDTGSVAGGGAIELVAEKGCITINATFRASAQAEKTRTKSCSGGSGGLIRLKAVQVEIQKQGKLNVDGGNGGSRGGGGAGGIIQIISPVSSLSPKALSLKRGGGKCGSDRAKADHGYYFVEGHSDGNNETFPDTLKTYRSNSSSSLSPCFPSTVTQESGHTVNVLSPSASQVQSSLASPTKGGHTVNVLSPSASQVQSSVASPTKGGHTVNVLSPSASQVQSSVASPTKVPVTVEKFVKKVDAIYDSLIQSGEINESAFRDVNATHKLLLSLDRSAKDTEILCLNIYANYTAIQREIAKRDTEFSKKWLRLTLDTASDCIHDKNHAFWRQNRKMPNLMVSLEEILIATVQGNLSSEINFTVTTSNIVAEVERKSLKAYKIPDYIKIPDYSKIQETSRENVDFVLIPKETVRSGEENYTYVFLLYKGVKNGLPNNSTSGTQEGWKVSSSVMSCFLMLDDKHVEKLSAPVSLTFKSSGVENKNRQCSYWNINANLWANDGMKELKSESNSKQTACQTNHFTSFAVLIQHKKIPKSEQHELALSIITYISCGVSTASLAITLIVLLSIESLSSERHKIHMNLALSLLLAQALFLGGIRKTSNKVLCKTIAVFLHYFFMTAFTWMLVEGVHLYLKVVQVFQSENIKMVYYYVLGWGFSLIPVSIAVAWKPDSYGTREICWLSIEDGTVWAFIGPVIAVITVNSFILFKVVHTVVTSAKAVKNSEHMHVKAGIKGLFVLMPLLGVGSILGFFAVNKNTIVFEYAFAIFNGLQGLLIFLLHCVFNSEVRQAFRRIREKTALSKEHDSNYHASFSLSQSVGSSGKKNPSSSSFHEQKAKRSFRQKKTKLVQVQPLNESEDTSDNSLKVKRTFEENNPNTLDITKEISSINCPVMEDEERISSKSKQHMTSQLSTSKRKNGRN